jgi:hypothetical protein
VARFAAPKYLACDSDVHAFFLVECKETPAIETEDLTRMLEFGVSQPSQVAPELVRIEVARLVEQT